MVTKHPLYNTWKNIRRVGVCSSWDSFNQFVDDVGDRPRGYIATRPDTSKTYSPTNFKWTDSPYRKDSKLFNVDGRLLNKSQLSKYLNISRPQLDRLIKSGIDLLCTNTYISIMGLDGVQADVAKELGLWQTFFFNKKDWSERELELYIKLLQPYLKRGMPFTYSELLEMSRVDRDSYRLMYGMSKGNSPRLKEVYEDMSMVKRVV